MQRVLLFLLILVVLYGLIEEMGYDRLDHPGEP